MRKRKLLCALLTAILLCTNIDITVFATAITETMQTEETSEEELVTEETSMEKDSESNNNTSTEGYQLIYQILDDGTAEITGYTGTAEGDLNIPSEIDGYAVTKIGKRAFYDCSGFTGDLVIPSSVTSIGASAFSGCYGFKGNLVIPSSVTDIGASAFRTCSFTGDLVIPSSVTSISDWTFAYNNFTGELVIPSSVTSIGADAFADCRGFTGELVISSSVKSIGASAFSGCYGFTGKLVIPSSVTDIGEHAFSGCSGFTGDLVIPSSVTSIGASAFYGCSGFKGNLVIPSSVTSIEKETFYNCSGFTGDLVIPSSVTLIGKDAFINCSGFTGDLVIPSSVTWISNRAFSGCSGFTGDLVISSGVNAIVDETFSGCSGFTGDLVIPSSVTDIGDSAFEGCSGFTGELVIPSSVTSIGASAFEGCSGFTGNLVIPSSVTDIGDSAFVKCSGLNGLSLPKYLARIGDSAFNGCSGLGESISFPSNLLEIGAYAFWNCNFVGDLVIPESVTKIGNGAFGNCSKLNNAVYIKGHCKLGTDVFGTAIDTIYGLSGSPAETYAKGNNLTFIPYNPDGPDNMDVVFNDKVVHVYVSDAKTGKFLNNAIVNDIVCENNNGYVMLELEEDYQTLDIVATAEGYYDQSFQTHVKKGMVIFVELYPIMNFGVVSAKARVGTWSTKDVLRDTFILEHTTEDVISSANRKTLTIDIKAEGEIATYELLQDGVIIVGGPDSELSIPVIEEDGVIKTNLLEENKPITIRVRDLYGSETSKVIGLRVEEEGNILREGDGSISLGDSLELEVPSDVPFVGGRTLKYGFEKDIPIQVSYSETDGKIRVALNMAQIEEAGWKNTYDNLKNKAIKSSDKAFKTFKDTGKIGPPVNFGAGCYSANVNVVGYGEAYIGKYNETVINLGIIVSGEFGGQYTHYFMAGVVPVYVSVKGEAGVSGDFSIDGLRIADESVSIDSFGLGKLGVKVSIIPSAGVGVKDLISVGVAGKGSLNIEGDFKNNNAKAWLDGSLVLYGEVFGAELSWSAIEATYPICEMPLMQEKNTYNANAMSNIATEIYDSSSYRLIDRGYLQQNLTSYADAADEGYVSTSVYPGASPKLVTVGDTLYLFWLQDINTRNVENRAALVYATSTDGNNWTAPKQLVDEATNQTMDGDYDVAVWNGKIYICWQDAADIFESGKTLNEMIQRLYISYAVLDGMTGEVLKTDTVTETIGSYLAPQIAVQNEGVKIAFVNNTMTKESGMWNTENTHSLMLYDAASDTMTTLAIGSGNEKIVSMDMLSSDTEAGVVYVVDNDGNYQTLDDRMVCMDNRNVLGNGTQQYLTSEAGHILGVTAAGNEYYWNADGKIYYTTKGTTESKTLYPEDVVVPNVFSVVTEGSRTTFLWEEICPETEKVLIYGIRNTESGWTLPYVLEETDSDMTSDFSGCYKDGKLNYTYLHVAKQEDGSYIRSICFDKEKSRKNISLDYAEYEMENFVKGEILPITAYITNKGNETIDNVNVYWDDTLLGNVTVAIPVGETVTVELKNFVVPEDVIGYEEHILKVSTENESDDSDNEYKLEIGMTDVAVSVSQRLKDGETWLDMGVYNTSCIATDVTLNIRADYLDGEILYTEELGTIEGGRGVTLTQPLEEYDKHYCTYYVEVVSTVQDALEGNNVEFVYTGAGRDVEGGELGYKPVYYTITFDSNGGSPIDSQTIEKGIFASQPMAPVKENHHFAGWYYNGVLYDFSSAVEEDITLTAQWTEYEKLVAPSANIVSGSKVDVGTKLALTCASVGASIYYTLDGTIPTTTADLYVEPITLLENTTVKAIAVQNGYYNSDVAEFTYEVVDMPNVYIVTFESNGGSIVESQQVVENECAARPTDPVWEGHKFLGWYVGDTLYDFKTPVTDHLRLEAKWEKVNTPEEDEPSEVLPEDIPEDGIIPEGIWVAGTKDTVYTGEAVKQEFRVYDHKTLLKEKIDYTVTYKNNKLAYVYSDEDYAAFEENLKTTGKKKTIGTFNPAKAPQIIITMKENYSGSHTIYYKNESADIAQEGFVAENLTVTYSGKKQTPQPILTWNGKKLKYGTDYYVREYDAAKKDKSAYTAQGSYDLTIVGKKNFKGEIPIQLTISEGVNQIAFSKVTIKGIKNVPWDEGRQIVQKDYKLSYKKDDFTGDNAEYTVNWGTNTDVGTGTVTFTGTGVDADKDGYSYIGSKTVTFKITGTAMKDVEVTGVKSSYPYTGETITAEEKLSYKKDKNSEPMDLYEDTHYSVEYRNNTDKGTATIIFTGKESGGFTGTKKVTFKITARGIQDIVLDGNVTPQVNVNFIDSSNMIDDVYVAPYMKGGVKPEVTVTCGEITLEAGKDYTVSYGNNQKLALYTDKKAPSITIKGKGNYTGSKTVYFSIKEKPLSAESGMYIVAKDKEENLKKNGYKQSFKVYDADGKALSGADYNTKDVVYTLIETIGKDGFVKQVNEVLKDDSKVYAGSVIEITVQGKGNYAEGKLTGTYRILEKDHDISKAVIQIENQNYTGKDILITEQGQFKPGKVYIRIGKEKRELILGEDIIVVGGSYVNNHNKGTAKVTFCGIGEFGGTNTVSFKIGSRSITEFWKGIFAKANFFGD